MIIVRKNDTIQKKTRNKRRSKIKIKHWIIRAVEAIYCIRQFCCQTTVTKPKISGWQGPYGMDKFPRVDESLVCNLVDVS